MCKKRRRKKYPWSYRSINDRVDLERIIVVAFIIREINWKKYIITESYLSAEYEEVNWNAIVINSSLSLRHPSPNCFIDCSCFSPLFMLLIWRNSASLFIATEWLLRLWVTRSRARDSKATSSRVGRVKIERLRATIELKLKKSDEMKKAIINSIMQSICVYVV